MSCTPWDQRVDPSRHSCQPLRCISLSLQAPDRVVPAMARNDPDKWRVRPKDPKKAAAAVVAGEEEVEDEYGVYFPSTVSEGQSDIINGCQGTAS